MQKPFIFISKGQDCHDSILLSDYTIVNVTWCNAPHDLAKCSNTRAHIRRFLEEKSTAHKICAYTQDINI